MNSGTVLGQTTLGAEVHDVFVLGNRVYVLTLGRLHVLSLTGTELGSFPAPGTPPNQSGRRRLFVAEDKALATNRLGYDVFNVADPGRISLALSHRDGQAGWQMATPNGSGSLLACVGPNSGGAPVDVALYAVDAIDQVPQFETRFTTPGIAHAVSIFNELAYVVDGDAGLHVVNYRAYDQKEAPPTGLNFTTDLDGDAIEGQPILITVGVEDDVQVRNVELLIDGEVAQTDGGYPFEFRFFTPLLEEATELVMAVRTTDTGGNSASTDPVTIPIVEDTVPPEVIDLFPEPEFRVALPVRTISAFFNEPIKPESVNATTFTLLSAGEDGLFDTQDDVPITATEFDFRSLAQAAFFNLAEPLADARYRAVLTTGVTDLKGNGLASEFVWTFAAIAEADDDGDGLPNGLEIACGLNPNDPDTDGDGIPDGSEETDGDSLTNLTELINGTNFCRADTDYDGLIDTEPTLYGTSAIDRDTDDDGFDDGDEVELGSNPLDPDSIPIFDGLSAGFIVRNHYFFSVVNKGFTVKNLINNTTVNKGFTVRNEP